MASSKKTKSKVANPKQNAKESAASDQASKPLPGAQLPLELQQLLLNIFKNAFSTSFNPDLTSVIQEVKQNLFRRDFGNAFGNASFLKAYVVRWSASRSIIYLNIFGNILQLSANLVFASSPISCGLGKSFELGAHASSPSLLSSPVIETSPSTQQHILDDIQAVTRVVCLGGGAGAEVVALAGYLSLLNPATPTDPASATSEELKLKKLHVTAIDIADWSSILGRLYSGTTACPAVPKYASPTAQTTNMPLVDPNTYEVHFIQHDILKMEAEVQRVLEEATLVTLMFTLNELYSTSMSLTTRMLLSMTSLLAPGSLLLVVDSPGSYSTVNIGCRDNSSKSNPSAEQKKYPMQWLLDHTLLEGANIEISENEVPKKQWEKLYSCDSTWFRLSACLKYPIPLEDMRYQVHLYRRS